MRAVSLGVLVFACGLAALSIAGCQRTVREACDELAAARCARLEACAVTPWHDLATCEQAIVTRCVELPDLPGAKLGADGLAACAAAYEGYPCESLVMGARPPECRFAGKGSNGSSCLSGAECQSTYCKADAEGRCGECSALREEGDTCSKGGSPCAAGLYCGDGRCVTYGSRGEQCSSTAPCNLLHWCDEQGTCAPQLGEGEPCTRGDQCSHLDRLVCDRTSMVCEAGSAALLATDGEPVCE